MNEKEFISKLKTQTAMAQQLSNQLGGAYSDMLLVIAINTLIETLFIDWEDRSAYWGKVERLAKKGEDALWANVEPQLRAAGVDPLEPKIAYSNLCERVMKNLQEMPSLTEEEEDDEH